MRRDSGGKASVALLCWSAVVGLTAFFVASAARRLIRGKGIEDFGDFHVFHDAFRAVLAGEDLYASGTGGYIYPPLFATVFAPLGLIELQHAGALFSVLNGVLLIACLWLAASEFVRRFDARVDKAIVPAAMLVAYAIFGDKVRSEFRLGQTDLMVLCGLLLALRWLGPRPILAGILLGLAGNLKYQSLVMLPYLLVRGRWRALGGALVAMPAFALSTALVHGWERNLAYLGRAFSGLSRMLGLAPPEIDGANIYPITWIRSVSLPSVFARIQEAAALPSGATPALTLLAAGVCLAGVAVLYRRGGQALFLSRTAARDDRSPRARALVALEWTGLIVAVLVFSPQTTARHVILMLPLGVLAGVMLLVPREGVRRLPLLAAGVFLLLALVLPPGGNQGAAVTAWRWIGGISIAALTLLYTTLCCGLRWARTLPAEVPPAEVAG